MVSDSNSSDADPWGIPLEESHVTADVDDNAAEPETASGDVVEPDSTPDDSGRADQADAPDPSPTDAGVSLTTAIGETRTDDVATPAADEPSTEDLSWDSGPIIDQVSVEETTVPDVEETGQTETDMATMHDATDARIDAAADEIDAGFDSGPDGEDNPDNDDTLLFTPAPDPLDEPAAEEPSADSELGSGDNSEAEEPRTPNIKRSGFGLSRMLAAAQSVFGDTEKPEDEAHLVSENLPEELPSWAIGSDPGSQDEVLESFGSFALDDSEPEPTFDVPETTPNNASLTEAISQLDDGEPADAMISLSGSESPSESGIDDIVGAIPDDGEASDSDLEAAFSALEDAGTSFETPEEIPAEIPQEDLPTEDLPTEDVSTEDIASALAQLGHAGESHDTVENIDSSEIPLEQTETDPAPMELTEDPPTEDIAPVDAAFNVSSPDSAWDPMPEPDEAAPSPFDLSATGPLIEFDALGRDLPNDVATNGDELVDLTPETSDDLSPWAVPSADASPDGPSELPEPTGLATNFLEDDGAGSDVTFPETAENLPEKNDDQTSLISPFSFGVDSDSDVSAPQDSLTEEATTDKDEVADDIALAAAALIASGDDGLADEPNTESRGDAWAIDPETDPYVAPIVGTDLDDEPDAPWLAPDEGGATEDAMDVPISTLPVPAVYQELEDLPPTPGPVPEFAFADGPQPDWGTHWEQSVQGWVEAPNGSTSWRAITSTSDSLSGWVIETYLGVVVGDSTVDTVEASAIGAAREEAVSAAVSAALRRGAHAVIGLRFTTQQIEATTVVTATGTAVTLSAS